MTIQYGFFLLDKVTNLGQRGMHPEATLVPLQGVSGEENFQRFQGEFLRSRSARANWQLPCSCEPFLNTMGGTSRCLAVPTVIIATFLMRWTGVTVQR